MDRVAAIRRRLQPVIKAVVLIELLYLVVINGLLYLPYTQTVVNSIRPEKFHATWERAWSWYPFRVHVRGLAANGQSRSQQWQIASPSVAGSIAVLPLLLKRVWVNDVRVTDIQYRQRPRLKPDRNYDQLLPYFAPIQGRGVIAADTSPRPNKRPWHIAVDGIRASGEHDYWIYQARGKVRGELLADLTFVTRGGPFSLDAHHLDLAFDSLKLNNTEEAFSAGTLRGALDFAPFVPRENKGVAMLKFLSADAQLQFDAKSLAFINLFTGDFKGMSVDGYGRVAGHLRLRRGDVLSGTDLSVAAQDLLVKVMGHAISGDGEITMALGEATGELLDLTFVYNDLQVEHIGDRKPLLVGQGLRMTIGGNGRVLPTPGEINATRSLAFFLDGLTVPDLSLLQHYLPAKWPLQLYAGTGQLQGMASMSPGVIQVDLALDSSAADLGAGEYRFVTNLEAAIKLDNPSVSTQRTRIAGSYIRLGDARLSREVADNEESWDASLTLNEGYFSLLGEQYKKQGDMVVDLLQELEGSAARELLSRSSASIDFSARVSSLAWIDVLLGGQYNTSVSGSGEVEGVIELEAALPIPGTEVQVRSRELTLEILDYVSTGDGSINLGVSEGDVDPDWSLAVTLADADFRRTHEELAVIQGVEMEISALIEDVDFQREEDRDMSLGLKISSGQVTDMSVFNAYLPPDSPLQLTGGTAGLSADILLQRDNARGWVKLVSEGIQAEADTQSIAADLELDVLLGGGVPRDMQFDISGSRMRLSNVRVSGDDQEFDQREWSASIELVRGHTTWSVPLRLDMEAQLHMSDTRPIVALFDNQGWRPEFLLKMMTVDDINGTASIRARDRKITISDALLTGDKIEIAAKATISPLGRDGVIYARYKKADALVKMTGGKKNVDIIRVREKFDAYEPVP